MSDLFIKEVKIREVLHLKNIQIPLGEESKKHLIITGKNGSGKSSVLKALKTFLEGVCQGKLDAYNKAQTLALNLAPTARNFPNSAQYNSWKRTLKRADELLSQLGGASLDFSDTTSISELYKSGRFIVGYFSARRAASFKVPKAIQKFNLEKSYLPDANVSQEFLQYIVNLKADKSFARDDGDTEVVEKIDQWFSFIEEELSKLFSVPDLRLNFDRKNYTFLIKEDGKLPYSLTQLSDGYASILSIVTELLLRMEGSESKSYDVQGVVLIDEIETHLHIDLQKKILPFLTRFFPKVQFIVTTHSPFVLSSIEDAVIWDAENKQIAEDLSGYSYDTLIESYFDSDKYSQTLAEKVSLYERLCGQETLTEKEKEEMFELKQYFKAIPKYFSDELAVKLQQIYIQQMGKK